LCPPSDPPDSPPSLVKSNVVFLLKLADLTVVRLHGDLVFIIDFEKS
jgi:hypothetical protein